MAEVVRLKEQARDFYQKGEWEKAKRAYEQLVVLESNDPESNLSLANVFLEMGDTRKALDQFEKSLRFAEKAGDFGRGIVAAKRILNIDKDRIELYNKLAELYNQLSLKTGAIRNWLKYADQMELRSDFNMVAAVYKKIGDLEPNPVLVQLGQRIDAVAHAAPADKSEDAPEPADITPYRRLVDVALKMGNPKKIVETQLTYARILQKRGFLRKAKTVYQKILEREPDNEEALERILACSDQGQGDESKAREELQALARQFQDQVWSKLQEAYEPYYDLGVLLRQNGLRDDAINEFQLAIKGGERQLKSFEMLAVSFLESGDYGLASEVLNQGLSVKKFLDNEYVGLHYNLGVAQEQLGNFDKALDELEQVYILDIAYKDVAVRMRRIEGLLKQQRGNAAAAPPQQPAPVAAAAAQEKMSPAPPVSVPQPANSAATPGPAPVPHMAASNQQLVAQLKERIAQARDRSAASRPAEPATQPQPESVAAGQPQEMPPEDVAAEEPDGFAGASSDEVLLDAEPAGQATPSEDGIISDKDQGLSFL